MKLNKPQREALAKIAARNDVGLRVWFVGDMIARVSLDDPAAHGGGLSAEELAKLENWWIEPRHFRTLAKMRLIHREASYCEHCVGLLSSITQVYRLTPAGKEAAGL